jgi:two-component system, OmpR family, copper resistance phosphate regulon response regulator CusR
VNCSDILQVEDLEIDRASHDVRRAGQRIELTAKEYALLEYLASEPGHVFSRTAIIEHVWGESFERLPYLVDVYVRHLRQKLDGPFSTKLIWTLRGLGYGVGRSPGP